MVNNLEVHKEILIAQIIAKEPTSDMLLFSATLKTALCLCLIFVCVYAADAISDEITIVADQWYPYNGQPNTAKPGYGVDLATEIFTAAGHTVVYQVMPWNRALIKTRQGRYTAVIGALREEAPDFIFPSEEFAVATEAFFAKKGCQFQYQGLESLKNLQIGIIKDYSYSAPLDIFFKENQHLVQYVKGDNALELNIKKLIHGRIDVLVEEPSVLQQAAKQLGVAEQLIRVGEHHKVGKLYIAFSPNHQHAKEYAQLFTQGMRKLQQSGRLNDLLNRYGLAYWK